MCEECGYTVLHGLRCPQRQPAVAPRCRICDSAIDENLPHLLYRRHRICYDCAEEMDLYDIKELLGVSTFALIALAGEGMGEASPVRSAPTTKPLTEC